MHAPAVTAAMCAHGRVVGEPRLSPGSDLVAFVATAAGRSSLVVVPATGGAEVVLTSDPPPRSARADGGGVCCWAPDGASLVYAGVDGGLWVAPLAGGPPRPLPVRGPAGSPAVSPDGRWVAHTVDGADVAVVAFDGASWPVRLSRGADFCFDPAWSHDGTHVVWLEWDVPDMPWDASRIVQAPADGSSPPVVLAGGPGVQVSQPRPGPHGLAHLCDRSGWLNLWLDDRHLVDEPFEHGDPTWGPGQRTTAWSPDGTRIAFCRNEGGFGRLCVVDVPSGTVVEVARAVHAGLSWVGDRLAAVRTGGRTPTQVVVYDTTTWERTTVAHGPVAGFREGGLVEPELVTWPADDGTVLHGRRYTPDGADPATSPALVWVHGGPTGQWQVVFNARIAYFLARGWVVLVPDHRGSTGHGRAYAQALRGRWGELDVADVAAGIRHAVAGGWCDPRRVAAIGGSSGGMTVLNLLAHHPDLCAAGVDLYGVADLFDLDESTYRFEAHYLHSIVGPLPEAAASYRDRSPLQAVDGIRAPLLVLHGGEDPVVPAAHSQAIVDRVRAAGGTVEHHLYPGEGHGWNRPEVVIDELGRIESFLRRHVLRWRAP